MSNRVLPNNLRIYNPLPYSSPAFNRVGNDATSSLVSPTGSTLNFQVNNLTVNGTSNIKQLTVPTNPVGTIITNTNPFCVYVQGRYVYVVNRTSNNLQIFDASVISSPTLISTTTTNGSPGYIYVQGHYAYISILSNILQIFDVSNPFLPIAMGSVTTGNTCFCVYVRGKYAYVCNNAFSNCFQIIDVSNPISPVVISTLVGTFHEPRGIYVQGRYAYIVDQSTSKLVIVDVSDPLNPFILSSTSTFGIIPVSIYVQGRYAYVGTYFAPNYLQIFDVSNPAIPVSVSTLQISNVNGGISSLYVQGQYAYLANQSTGQLQIVDVSNPALPFLVGSSLSIGTLNGIFIQGRYAYVVNSNNTLQIFDLGGTYIQQLEVGGMEVGTLQTRNNLTINNDLDVKGGAIFGQGFTSQATSSVNINTSSQSGTYQNVPALSLIGNSTGTTTTPLNLQGLFSQAASNALNVDANGNVFIGTSSGKYKQNIRNMMDKSELIYSLRPVIYDPIDERGYTSNIPGFIAEEVYENSNNNSALVCFDANGKINNVNYIPFHALTVNELQKQNNQIDELMARIEKLLI